VSVIITSYGFFGVGALIAFVNLFLFAVQSRKNHTRISVHIQSLTRIIEIILTIGLYLITIGTFLGAVWANVSWGKYWSWDPKETWALISVIVYAFILHMRLIPGFRSDISFNILALLAFSSILMTYFGVNYYLAGMHSYAQGDSAPIPSGTYIGVGTVALLCVAAVLNNRRTSSSEITDE
jgi:ABC-type transport system involved in cytochrome c biogenesis permease subunit